MRTARERVHGLPPGYPQMWCALPVVGICVERVVGQVARIPGLKRETWGTHSFVDGQTWATRHPRIWFETGPLGKTLLQSA
jgi:hypothetical protein